jgi:hypothetical protein
VHTLFVTDKSQEIENLVDLGGDGRIPLKYINWDENLRDSD